MISIIIPTYNRGKHIARCLDNILVQNYSNYEIIIINDASTDNTLEILEEYKEKLGLRLTIRSQKRSGPQVARNLGARLAKGEFIIFCDADIIMEISMLKDMLETLRNNPEKSYVYSSFIWVKKLFKLGPFDEAKLKKMPYIHTTSLIRKEHFPGWDENIKRLQDWDLWLTMLENGHTGIWLDKVLFRKQSGGTMSSWLPKHTYTFLPFLPGVIKYKKAVKAIKIKHNL